MDGPGRLTRVAIIGGGPRAGQAVETLASLGMSRGVCLPDVDVIAPGVGVGAGEIFAEHQPDWLRLNVASSVIDAWSDASHEAMRGVPFDAWREARSPGSTTDQFPARSLAGRYLAEAGSQVRAEIPGRRRTGRALAVRPTDRGWRIDLEGEGHLDGYDEVLLATGHVADWSGSLRHQAAPDAPLVSHVFPVDHLMDRAAGLATGSLVVIRGAALTAIDAALSLAKVRDVGELRIVLASRTGRLMMPKTETRVLQSIPGLDDVETRARRRVLAGDCIPEVLVEVAGELLTATGCGAVDLGTATHQLLSRQPSPKTPSAWLRRQLEIATGRGAPDAEWALAQAWRLAYAAIVDRQRVIRPQTPTLGWPGYGYWAVQMERVAFGPPPVNGQALLDLLDAGAVEVIATDDVLGLAERRGAALVVDGVLAPPGVRGVRDPLVGQLVSDGLVEGSRAGRGVVVGGDAASIVHGRHVRGLSVVGRLTEDVVVGNDTLNRRLHPHIDLWAHRVLGLEVDANEGIGRG